MKYLRIYEEFMEMWEPMDDQEFNYNRNQKKPFTPKELEQTKKLLKEKGYELFFMENEKKTRAYDNPVLLRFEKIVDNSMKSIYGTHMPGQKRCIATIYKIEDDYFPVGLRDEELNHRFISNSFYKCDQFEGLVNFIKERL